MPTPGPGFYENNLKQINPRKLFVVSDCISSGRISPISAKRLFMVQENMSKL